MTFDIGISLTGLRNDLAEVWGYVSHEKISRHTLITKMYRLIQKVDEIYDEVNE